VWTLGLPLAGFPATNFQVVTCSVGKVASFVHILEYFFDDKTAPTFLVSCFFVTTRLLIFFAIHSTIFDTVLFPSSVNAC